MDRRKFLQTTVRLAAGLTCGGALARAAAPDFYFTRLMYESGDWWVDERMPANILDSLIQYTTIRVDPEERIVPLADPAMLHAPFCYLLGITSMELLRADGRSLPETASVVVRAMFRNSLMIGIGLGFVVNISGLSLPAALVSALDIMTQAALPAALFGLGGTLTRYSLKGSIGEAGSISAISLAVHPGISFAICHLLGVPDGLTGAVVLMAAMAPGINSYLFASMYRRGQGTAASVVLLGTAVSILSVRAWLWILRMA